MPTVQVNMGTTAWNVRDEGRGPVLLLVHGFPLSHRMWDEQFAELSSHFRLIAPDLRGFGESLPIPETLSMQQLADDLADILDALGVAEPVTLVGLSMGGYVAWQFWAHHLTRLQALVLCDTRATADAPQTAEGRRRLADRVLEAGPKVVTDDMVPKLFAPESHEHRAKQVQETIEIMNATHPRTIAAAQRAMASRPDMTDQLAAVQLPVLVLCGEHDKITPPAEMKAMAEKISTSQYVEIPSAGHMAPLEQPAVVNRILRQFVMQISS